MEFSAAINPMSCESVPSPLHSVASPTKESPVNPFKSTLVACLSTLALLASTASHADMLNLGATLSGAAEVPPNTSAGMGQLQAEFDKATKTLRYTLR